MTLSLLFIFLCHEPPPTLAQAAALYHLGDCSGAAALYAPLVIAYPDRPGLRLNLARCLAGMGKPGEAIAEATTAVAMDPTSVDALWLWWRLRAEADAPLDAAEIAGLLHRLATSKWSAVAMIVWELIMLCGVQWFPSARRTWFLGAGMLPSLWLLLLLTGTMVEAMQPPRVVVVAPATLRAGNGFSYPPAPWLGRRTQVVDGVVAQVRAEAANGWRQVVLPDRRVGWLPPATTRELQW